MAKEPVARSKPGRFGRFLSWLVFIPMLVIGILLAVSNREVVQITLQPTPLVVEAPQYVVIFAAAFVGIMFGALAMWLRDGKVRRRARDLKWQTTDLSRDLKSAQTALENRTTEQEQQGEKRDAA